MPTGIILKSASHEVSDEVREKNLEAVVEAAGYEVEKPEVAPPAEPKRDDFKNEEEFEAAHVAWQDSQKTEEVEEEEEVEASPAPKKPSRKERAVARATSELQRKLDEANARIAELQKKEEPPKDAPKPKRADFADDEAFEDALVKWGVAKAKQEQTIKDVQEAENARIEEIIGNYGLQVEEAKEEHADWDELKEKFEKEDIFIGHAAQLTVLEQENGAEVTYYLMRHPAFAAKLGKMAELSAVAEVVRLSDRLKTGTPAPSPSDEEKSTKPKPKVPAPVRTVNTAGSSATPTFAEIAARPNYPGKARDLRAAQAAGR